MTIVLRFKNNKSYYVFSLAHHIMLTQGIYIHPDYNVEHGHHENTTVFCVIFIYCAVYRIRSKNSSPAVCPFIRHLNFPTNF
jgi:hypothetical protein